MPEERPGDVDTRLEDEPDEADGWSDETTPGDRRRRLVIALFVGVSLVVAIALAIVYSMPSAD